MKKYTSVKEQVEYGLDTIDPDQTLEISVRDLIYINQGIREFIQFFHQPLHYPTLDHVKRFLGTSKSGGLAILWYIYYQILSEIFPPDVQADFESGERFNNPNPPYYYESNNIDKR